MLVLDLETGSLTLVLREVRAVAESVNVRSDGEIMSERRC